MNNVTGFCRQLLLSALVIPVFLYSQVPQPAPLVTDPANAVLRLHLLNSVNFYGSLKPVPVDLAIKCKAGVAVEGFSRILDYTGQATPVDISGLTLSGNQLTGTAKFTIKGWLDNHAAAVPDESYEIMLSATAVAGRWSGAHFTKRGTTHPDTIRGTLSGECEPQAVATGKSFVELFLQSCHINSEGEAVIRLELTNNAVTNMAIYKEDGTAFDTVITNLTWQRAAGADSFTVTGTVKK